MSKYPKSISSTNLHSNHRIAASCASHHTIPDWGVLQKNYLADNRPVLGQTMKEITREKDLQGGIIIRRIRSDRQIKMTEEAAEPS